MWNLVGNKSRGVGEVGHIENLLQVKSCGDEEVGHIEDL